MERRGKHNSFVLYTDYSQHIALLSNEEAGRLFKALFEFVETGELPDLSGALAMCFSFISSQIQRDKEKYKETCEKRAEAGRLGGMQKQANVANASFDKEKQTNAADNDIDNENDNVKKNIYDQQVEHLCLLLNQAKEKARSKGRLKPDGFYYYYSDLIASGIRYEDMCLVAEEFAEQGKNIDWYGFRDVLMKQKAKGGI